jgi:iron complex outermembrane recepter protein
LQFSAKYHTTSGRNEIQVGTDNSVSWDKLGGVPGILFEPADRTVRTLSAFGSHTMHWAPDRFASTLGAKIEDNSFSGFEIQPTLRGSWTPTKRTTIWGAVSRAVRTPVRFDHDVRFPGVFEASDDFDAEVVVARELGLRHRLSDRFAVDVALFSNRYDKLRAYQPIGATFLPLTFQNRLNATGNGAEVTLLFQPHRQVFMKGTYRYFHLEFSEDPGSINPFGTRFEANDARHLATLSTRIDLPGRWELDTTLRHVGSLPWRRTKGYVTADLRLGWSPHKNWELALIGRNLLEPYHLESIIPQNTTVSGSEVRRSVAIRATWKF